MRAFLSSTFWDLRPERGAARKALAQLDHELEAMELFLAKPTEPLKAVLENLRRCDFIVLLVGSRAGSLLPKRKGLTYTQAEYRHAKQLNLPIFVFVKTSRGKWHNLEPKSSRKRASLDKFHKLVTSQHLPRHFASPHELDKQIVSALLDWDTQGRPAARRVFSTPQQFFRAQISGRTLLDYEQTLRGRSVQKKQFDDFMLDPETIVALLKGRGGIGKTKLIRDWTIHLPGWKVFVVNDAAHWHSEAFKELPNGKILLIHDDAHRSDILNELAVLTRDLRPPGSIKLLLAYRPSGSHLVEAAVSRFFGQELTFQMTSLEQLSHVEVRAIAAEVLGPSFHQYAEQLTIVSRDTPLVTVVGGKLLARRQIHPSLLANEETFRRTVFDRFIQEQQGQLPGADINVRPLLEVLAATGPISPSDNRFLEKAKKFLTLRTDQILKAVDVLVRGGLLLKGGSLVRIVPDVLSDFVLERACIDSTGQSTQFADAIYREFGDVFLSNLLRNLGELDWRITHGTASGSILDSIWSTIQARFNEADAFERKQLLESIQPAAIVQPAPCLALVRNATCTEAQPTPTPFKDFSYAQKDVLEEVPSILGGIAYDPAYTTAAMQLLWSLAKGPKGSEDAAKEFESFASYGRYKSVFYNNSVAEFLNGIVSEPDAFSGEFTALNLADKLLAKEGDFTELDGMVFHIGSFILNFKAISHVRKRAFAAIEKALFSDSARAAVRAVTSLAHVMSAYLPRLRATRTAEEVRWQNRERSAALSLLKKRAAAGPHLVVVLQQIRHVLESLEKWRKGDNRHLTQVRNIAASIDSDDVDILDAFVSTSWQFDRIDEKGNFLSGHSKRQAQIDNACRLLERSFPSPREKVEQLERLYSWATDAGVDKGEHLQFVDEMCKKDPGFCSALANFIISGTPSDNIAWTLQVTLRNLLQDPTKYESISVRAAAHNNPVIVRSAGSSLFYVRPDEVTRGELELFAMLAPKADFAVRMNVLGGLKWLAKDLRFREYAVHTALLVDLNDDEKITDEFCKIFGPYGIGSGQLDLIQIRAILNKLEQIAIFDEPHCQQLLGLWTRNYPNEIFDFLLRRIEISLKREAAGDWKYHAIPRNISLREIVSGPQLIPKLRSVLDKFIESNYARAVRKFFWALAMFDDAIASLLQEYIESQSEPKVKAIIELLEDAPKEIAFSYPQFTKRILQAAEKLGTKYKDTATVHFIVKCQPGAFVGGAASPELSRIRDRAAALMTEYSADPLLYPVYHAINSSVTQTIKTLQISEADMHFQHS